VSGGKIVEQWGMPDVQGLMTQLKNFQRRQVANPIIHKNDGESLGSNRGSERFVVDPEITHRATPLAIVALRVISHLAKFPT
jgi:hypothetical protein